MSLQKQTNVNKQIKNVKTLVPVNTKPVRGAGVQPAQGGAKAQTKRATYGGPAVQTRARMSQNLQKKKEKVAPGNWSSGNEGWQKPELHVKKEKTHAKKEERQKVPKKEWYDYVMDIGKDVVPKLLPLLMGAGDYTESDMIVKSEPPETNSLLAAASNGNVASTVPMMHSTGETVRIVHREYLGDVYSSVGAFIPIRFPLNPGLSRTFPWLSKIANQFTSYSLKGCVVEFISEGSEYTNSAGLGFVAMAVQYDSAEAPFSTKRDLLNSQFANAAKPSCSFQMWVECADKGKPLDQLYVRQYTAPVGTDIRMYDTGLLTVAVGGNVVSDVIIGELWVTYDVELLLPISNLASGGGDATIGLNGAGPTPALPFGVAPTVASPISNVDWTYQFGYIEIPPRIPGLFLLVIRYTFTGTYLAVNPLQTISVNDGLIVGNSILDAFSNFQNGVGVEFGIQMYTIRVADPAGCNLRVVNGINRPANCTVDTFLTQLPDNDQDLYGSVYDANGRCRDAKYEAFMSRITQGSTASPVYQVIKETNSFQLSTDGRFYLVKNLAVAKSFAVEQKIAQVLITLGDSEFDNICSNLQSKD